MILGYRCPVTSGPDAERGQLPRSRYPFASARAGHVAAVLGIMVKEVGALDCSDVEIAAAADICRLLADLDPHGEGVPSRKLFERLESQYPRLMLNNRLAALMKAGAVEKGREVINEQDVRLALSGALSLVLVPWLSTMSGQRALLEALSRVEARAASPDATVDDVRADLAALRRILTAFANDLRRIVDGRRTAEMIQYGKDANDHSLRSRIDGLRATVVRRFADELINDLGRLSEACDSYILQHLRLGKQLSASRVTQGHWARSDEVHEVMEHGALTRLAALWDGIAFDAAPVWVSPGRVLKAVEELTTTSADGLVPEAGKVGSESAAPPDPREVLAALAERLLDEADQRDLTELFLSLPWPDPAVILARLSVLEGLGIGYGLAYPGHLAMRVGEATARVATGVILRRVPVIVPEEAGSSGAQA